MSYASLSHFSASRRSGLLATVVGGHIALFMLLMAAKTVVPQIAQLPIIVDLLPAPPVAAQAEPAATPLPVAPAPRPEPPKPKPRPVLQPKPAPTPKPAAPVADTSPTLETTTSTEPAAENAPSVSGEATKAATPAPSAPSGGSAHGSGDPTSTARFDADYLRNPAPPYPPLSRRMREEGKVVLRVQVTPEGGAASVEIKTSSGSQRLDDSALRTVRNWKFIPAKRGGTPVESWVLVPIIFKLEQ